MKAKSPRVNRKARDRGPYALPLPAFGSKRPGWMNGNGDSPWRNAWGHEVFDTWKASKRPKPVPMPETEIEWGDDTPTRWVWAQGTYEERPIRVRQEVYAWDDKKQKWVKCRSTVAIAKYARSA